MRPRGRGPVAQRQSTALIKRGFWVRIPAGPFSHRGPHRQAHSDSSLDRQLQPISLDRLTGEIDELTSLPPNWARRRAPTPAEQAAKLALTTSMQLTSLWHPGNLFHASSRY